jgi:D-inositol-3-phosphate glycosyltransferase
MNIIIAGTAYPFRGGLAAYNERLAREFISQGNVVKILTFTVQYPGFLFPGTTQFLDAPPPQGLHIERKISSINPFNWLRVGYTLKRENPDILIFKYWLPFMAPCFGTIARIVRANGHTKVVCILDNVIPHEARAGDRLLTAYFMAAIDGAVAMSDSVLSDLRKFNKLVPARLNPHPLFDNFGAPVDRDLAHGTLGLPPDIKCILFFGFIRAYKGLDLLIEAFADPRFRNRNMRLLIAGEFYEDKSPYTDLIRKYCLENEISLFDRFINDDEVALFFSAADLVVQPYRSATQSGVTQIAYHFEKPMLVTDVGGLKEIVPDGRCGYIVSADPESIAVAIDDFFTGGRKEFFTANIKTEKLRFLWSRMCDTVLAVYNTCIGNDNKK